MSKVMTAEKAFAEVRKQAERIKNDEPATVGTVSIGDVVRQGDLYLVAIGDLPAKRTPTGERQLAPGNTQGSRHVLAGECEVFTAEPAAIAALVKKSNGVIIPAPLLGPVFRTVGEVTVEHPEHGHRALPAGECFATVYQRAFADEVRRAQD